MNATDVGGRPRRSSPPAPGRVDPVGVLLVVAVVAVSLTAAVTVSRANPGAPCGCPAMTVVAVDTTPAAAHPTAAGNFYTFTITQVVNPPATYGDFSVWFTSPNGVNVAPGAGWTLTVHSSAGNFTAGFTSPSQQLSAGGSVPVVAGAQLTVYTRTYPLNGGEIILDGNGGGHLGGWSTVFVD